MADENFRKWSCLSHDSVILGNKKASACSIRSTHWLTKPKSILQTDHNLVTKTAGFVVACIVCHHVKLHGPHDHCSLLYNYDWSVPRLNRVNTRSDTLTASPLTHWELPSVHCFVTLFVTRGVVLFGLVWVLLPFDVASWQGDIEKVKSCKVDLKYERSAF